MGESQKGREDLVIEAQGKMGLRMGDWVMLPPYKGPQRNETGNELGNMPEFTLYNVTNDRQQTENQAVNNPEQLEKMKERFFDLTKGYYKAEVEEVELK